MKYKLKILMDIDDNSNNATMSIDGATSENEECHYIFTDSNTVKGLYNDIVQLVYKAGKASESDVYEVNDTLNGVDQDLEGHLESKNIRKGVFVESGLSWFDDASKYYKGLVEVQRRTYALEELIKKLIGNLLSMKNNEFISEEEKKYIEQDTKTLKAFKHMAISTMTSVKTMLNDWTSRPKPFSTDDEAESENKTLKDFISDMYSNMRKIIFADSVSSPSESFKYDYNWRPLNGGMKTRDAVDSLAEGMGRLLSKEENDISNPSHYTDGRKYEPRKVIEDWDLNWNLGNAVKYISRAGRKDDPVKDLKKARQYIDFEIDDLETGEN